MAIQLKSRTEIDIMRESGRINAEALMRMRDAVRPGITTRELDQIAAEVLAKYGARPAFLGHPKGDRHPFPAVITASIN
jgi:methionyl aminopeptidase